jgi:diaminopimelate epimerase
MGTISDLNPPTDWHFLGVNPDRPVRHVSLGNPHSVVGVDDVTAVPLQELGPKVPNVNLEIVAAGPEDNAVTMRVHERGSGITMACGTGACAAAEAAVAWGLVPANAPEVLVHMDGGDARVVVDRETRGITLIAEATFVATITVAT